MPLSWNEIRDRALKFSREWADEASEDAEAKSFWDGFFNVFGVSRRRVATFERKVKKLDGKDGFIDLLWKGVLLVEHKSKGKDLDRAHTQAKDYFQGLTDAELPRYLLVSDFARFRLYDLEGDEAPMEFTLAELHKNVRCFGFISGYQVRTFKEEDPVNVQAAERMGKLHDALNAAGYSGHALEVLLVRLLFCLFADDTGIFPRYAFHELISQRTSADGSDLGMWLGRAFQVLNTPTDRRQKTLDEQLAELPYVNGRLFEEMLPLADFNAAMRHQLLEASALDWSRISPAIFGSMFQSVMDAKARRNLGAHYTSEKNILKLIGPLFLDGLKEDLAKAKNDPKKLDHIHRKLASLRFLDPACGCGNFLVLVYRELRELEREILTRRFATQQSVLAHVQDHALVDVDQFYGIEIEEFPAQIAQVAMWLMDHQMNLLLSEQFGENVVRLPLKKSATIVHGNALELDWKTLIDPSQLNYILGNPPFSGAMVMNDRARNAFSHALSDLDGSGVLDFVSAWYWLAAKYIAGTRIEVGFVSTNSICQGEQVGILWRPMLDRFGIEINFAHRTFKWSNEARGIAAVHCIIVGFAAFGKPHKTIYDYAALDSDPHALPATNISPYLIDAPNIIVENRARPLCPVPVMRFGSMPRDGGNLLLSRAEMEELIQRSPHAIRWIRPYVGSDEFLNGKERWCLWLDGITPAELHQLPQVLERIELTRKFRLLSKAASTRNFAKTPSLFCQIAQPSTDYLLVPGVSSERRAYIPIGFMKPDVIANNLVFVVPDATRYHFGVLSSQMHMTWVRHTCGRLKSDFRYSKDVVYNNFPWPEGNIDGHRDRIEEAANRVLAARSAFMDSTLAQLYDPRSMPSALVKAHTALDRAVATAYSASERGAGNKAPKLDTEAERAAFLFEQYRTKLSKTRT
ncbi:class I SAM-dependent DNA methyltransferase [Arenimonas sp.]|uniref:class I SAM-dependent DNA methyltransferase n=1 Tax=Arenimonas sp. TaxID=1872635 RepID=UPI0035AE91D5